MDPLHAVYLTVGLFVITFFNPGANLFVVVQTSLASGRRAGVLTGLGGDCARINYLASFS